MGFIEASKTGSKGGGDGVPVGALMTFSGSQLPDGYEPAETEEQISIQQLSDNLTLYDVDNEEYTTDKFRFAKSGDEFGYLDEDDNFVAFGGGEALVYIGNYTGNQTIDVTQYIKSGDTIENFIIEYLGCNSADSGTCSSSSATKWRAYASGFTPSKSLSGTSLSIVMSSGLTLYKGTSDPATNYAGGGTLTHKYNLYYKK